MEQGKKMALIVGCNYPNTPNKLHGCHNDALAIRDLRTARFEFIPDNIGLMMDKPESPIMPTGANIKTALNKMVDRAKKGDVLFFHYSGHGTLIERHGLSKREEAIVPCDFNLSTRRHSNVHSELIPSTISSATDVLSQEQQAERPAAEKTKIQVLHSHLSFRSENIHLMTDKSGSNTNTMPTGYGTQHQENTGCDGSN
ncbi:metacaspase 9 [Striga asiatica]|uniref:Metacaspase 9 n=1 Tax=Striga asiatica TaxID=4170 RepID=A0A5A7P7J6_STRAF|nr:metacaspase 9 [Striga asiatica]